MYRVFQHAAGGTILSGLKRYLLATTAGVIVPRVIAVGQHCSSALRNPFLSQRLNVRLRGAVRLRRKWRTKAARVELHIDAHIGRGHNAAKHSFLSAIVKAVLAEWPG